MNGVISVYTFQVSGSKVQRSAGNKQQNFDLHFRFIVAFVRK